MKPEPAHPKKRPASDVAARAVRFGGMLRHHRIGQRLPLRELSHRTGIDIGYLSRMERGLLPSLPLADTIDRLATALSLNPMEHRTLYTAVGELTEDTYLMALRFQRSPELFELARVLTRLPTQTLLEIGGTLDLNGQRKKDV